MYEYTIVSDIKGVPELVDRGAASESRPTSRGAVVEIAFANAPGLHQLQQAEPAVAARWRVTRTDDEGTTLERGGAVLQVSPRARVSLDGGDRH